MAAKFSEFLEFCKDYLKDAKSKDIQKLIHKRYNDCSAAYIDSSGFSDLLCITRAKIESDPQHFFVHLRDFLNELKESKYKRQAFHRKRTLEDTDDSCSSPKVAWSEENSNQSANASCFRDAFKRFLSQRVATEGSDGHVSSNSQEGNFSDGQVSSGQQKGDVSDFDGHVSSEQQKGDVSDSDGQVSSEQQKGEVSDSDGHVSSNSQEGNISDGQVSSEQQKDVSDFDGHVSSNSQEGNISDGQVSSEQQKGDVSDSDGHMSSNSQEGNISDGQVSSGQQKGDVSDFDGHVSSEQQKGDVSDSDGHVSSEQQKGDVSDSDGQVSSEQQKDVSDFDGHVSSNSQEGNISDGQVSSEQQKGDVSDSDGLVSSGQQKRDVSDREIDVFDGHVSSDGQEVNVTGHVSSNSPEENENLAGCDYNSDSQTKASEDSFVESIHPVATQQEKVDPDKPTVLQDAALVELHTKVNSSDNESINSMGITIAEVKSLTSIDDDISTYASSGEISNDTNASTKSQLEITNNIKRESDKSITISKNDVCDELLFSDEDNIEETKSQKSLLLLESEEDGVYAKDKVFELTVDYVSNKFDSENVSLTPDKSSSSSKSQFNKNKDQKVRNLLRVESCHSESDSDRAGIRKNELLDESFASTKTSVETDDDVSVIAGDVDNKSSHYQTDDAEESSASVQARKKGSRRQIEYLEKLLKKLRDKIESIQSRELSLDDLDDEISDYILEDKYQKKFVKVWEKLCQLKERETTTGRPLERKFIYEGTRYPEINTQIQKFVNRNKIFPDYHDIKRLVTKANTFFKLNLRTSAIESIAREAFTDVGNQLQQRRIEDFRLTFGSSLTDQCRNKVNPALLDTDLQRKLEQNKSVSKNRLDDVINKYAELQYSKGDNEEEEEEEEEASSQASSEREEEEDIHMGDFEHCNDQEETDPEQKSPAHSNESMSSDEELPEFSGSTVLHNKICTEGELHEKDNLSVKPYLHSIFGNSQEICSTGKQLVEESSASSVEQTLSTSNVSLKKTVDSVKPGTSKAITRDTFSIVINDDDDDDGTIPMAPILSSSRGIKRKQKMCSSGAEKKQVGLKRVEPKPISTDHDIQIESQIKIHSKIRFLEPTIKKQKLDWEMGQEEMDIIQNYSAPDDVIILSDSD